MERLHHATKKVLDSGDRDYSKLSKADRTFIEEAVDFCDGKLSENRWKKLYACLAQLASDTRINYRIYRSPQGHLFDTTNHQLTSEQEIAQEHTHATVEGEVIQTAEADARVVTLKRWRFEIDQLNIKIRQMSEKKDELIKRYAKLHDEFISEFELNDG
jgi:hypothetical protein